ncbi:hypothetical protein C6497_08315 [Candidatus Poribacteria bacterium]|nr:MAG: hypothetical protein C6497_08315 [Candidatus Poribacteria bacterium]
MIKENIYTIIQISIIRHTLDGKLGTKESANRSFFNFITQTRKLAVNIGGYLLNSDNTKIGVTEKSYDFVTFSHNYFKLYTNSPIHIKSSKKQKLQNMQKSMLDIYLKGRVRPKITQLQNFYNSNKTRINTRCNRADSRFTNDTPCDKKCNILNNIELCILQL